MKTKLVHEDNVALELALNEYPTEPLIKPHDGKIMLE